MTRSPPLMRICCGRWHCPDGRRRSATALVAGVPVRTTCSPRLPAASSARHARPAGSLEVDRRTLGTLAGLLSGVWTLVDGTVPEDGRARRRAHEIVAGYTQHHLERRVRSLPHVAPDDRS
jgi:hypothetical protein